MPSTSPHDNQKKNKGGRPRKTSPAGKQNTTWKIISDPPGSINHYEISAQGQVRRKLKSGSYSMVKPWVTGGPYAAVYLYGFKNVHRNRKKAYIHRLVATHFVKGRKKGEVVHHKLGPANNTASQLERESVDENSKARKYFNPDGTKKVKKRIPLKKPSLNAFKEKKQIKPNPDHEPDKLPEPKVQKQKAKKVQAPVQPKGKPKPKHIPPPPKPKPQEREWDPDEYIPNVETTQKKIRFLMRTFSEVKEAMRDTRKVVKKLKTSNVSNLLKEATGKALKFNDNKSPYHWKIRLISALYSIKTRLET